MPQAAQSIAPFDVTEHGWGLLIDLPQRWEMAQVTKIYGGHQRRVIGYNIELTRYQQRSNGQPQFHTVLQRSGAMTLADVSDRVFAWTGVSVPLASADGLAVAAGAAAPAWH